MQVIPEIYIEKIQIIEHGQVEADNPIGMSQR